MFLSPPGAALLALAAAEIVVDKNLAARMRDGVLLRADVYRPSREGRYPALLMRTPYSKNPAGDPREEQRLRRLAEAGFVVVAQDTRGRYASDGTARPHDEAEDGYDSVEWVASLPFVDGKVGMFGASYLATTQLTAATLRPPHLAAIAPFASYARRYDLVYPGGAFYLGDGLAWNLGQSLDARRRAEPPEARDAPLELGEAERRLLREGWYWHVPLAGFDALELRRYHPGYFELLSHPTPDGFWGGFDIASRHGEIDVPALHLTGWYDTLVGGTLANFSGLRRAARSAGARQGQRLIVGPWTHASPGRDSTRVGDVDFGAEAGLDAVELLIGWFDHRLRGGDSPLTPAARVFVMGENRWRDEPEWPLARARPTPLFLGEEGRLLWTPPGASAPPARYVYDPWDPAPAGATGGYSRTTVDPLGGGLRPDVLRFESEALAQVMEVTGPIELVLWVASSAPDTDFTGRLFDVPPSGAPRVLTDGILRARYRKGKAAPELLTAEAPEPLAIDLGVTSNLFLPGHRIRLDVSSSNFPRFDRNPNTGTAVAYETRLVRARQTVFRDASHPSRLVLPIVARGAAESRSP